jgi:hypothetical protein
MTDTMTETQNLPAVRAPSNLDDYARLGTWLALAESGSENERAKGAAAALRLYYAHELGLSVLAASELSVIRGRLVVGAKLLRARALDAGYRVERVESSDRSCTARLIDKATGEIIGETTYTIEQARRAGIVKDKGAWVTYPERMLWARASKFVLDDYAPHVSLGMLEEDEAREVIDGEVLAEISGEPEPVSTPAAGGPGVAESKPPHRAGDAALAETPAPSAAQSPESAYAQAREDHLLTYPQFSKLNVQVGTMREAGQLNTEQLYAVLASHRGKDVLTLVNELHARDDAGVLHWSPLRDTLTRSEASRLIDWLERRADAHPAQPETPPGEFPDGY